MSITISYEINNLLYMNILHDLPVIDSVLKKSRPYSVALGGLGLPSLNYLLSFEVYH